jgi:acyl carrier protein
MEKRSMNTSEIEQKVISVLNDMTQDWELDSDEGIGPKTGLMNDLEFESIDIVQLAVALEQNFDKKGLPFEQLFMKDGDYVDEIYVSELVEFMGSNLNA